ncbi:pilus assembly protein TadG-related protein [Qipengyuania sp. DSG2-2]|uniref:pilus assembly protein TadG-related protein n=1 Tax=Qipengyuania sp. DGS2-2 TaxID=3349631 RepID=UPI0036D37EC7
MKRIQHLISAVRRSRTGNAATLLALGLPMLVGGTGFAVDTAQWYLWKRELQYAADQAAIAGAWARSDSGSSSAYAARADKEFNSNLDITSDFAATPVVGLADWDGETDASVTVEVTASRQLPFSSFLTNEAATIRVRAQAAVVPGEDFFTCMLAVDPSASGAFELGGNTSGNAPCGFGAISNSGTAMVKNGNPSAWAGQLISNGGIEDGYDANGEIFDNVGSLSDPFAGITPPSDTTSRTYSCPTATGGSSTATATVTTVTYYDYQYYIGKNPSQATYDAGYAGPNSDYTTSAGPVTETVAVGTTNGASTTQSPSSFNKKDLNLVGGSGNKKVYEWLQQTITKTYSNVTTTTTGGSDGIARPEPGTYGDINIACTTEFQPGVYTITGELDFGQNQVVTGSDVLFVITGSGRSSINSKSEINLSGITDNTLQTVYGLSAADAAELAGMIIFDPESTDEFKVNGGADMVLNGNIYMPKRKVTFNGNSALSGVCLQVVAGTIKMTGSNTVNAFCVPTIANPIPAGTRRTSVRLVG